MRQADQLMADLERRTGVARGEIITEYAALMPSGDHCVFNPAPGIERIYPMAQRVVDRQRDGGKVHQRRVIVVEDWAEVKE